MRMHIFLCSFVLACSSGTVQGTDAGSDSGSDSGSVDLNKLGSPCRSGACPSGLEPVTYCGFAGCGDGGSGQSCSCEIKCGQGTATCPSGTNCVTISDGPGDVCVKN